MFITTLLNTVSTLGELVGLIKSDNFDLESKVDLIESRGSISRFTSSFVLEPVIVIDDALASEEKKGDIIKYQLKLFTTYILQIFYKSINVDGIEPRIAFELISSNSSSLSASLVTAKNLIGLESKSLLMDVEAGMEAKVLTEDLSGAYNYVVDVEFTIGERTVKMPIIIKPIIVDASISEINELIENEDRSSLGKSIEDLSLGLRSVWDIISANSLIEKARKTKFSSSNELISLMKDRVNKARTKIKYGALGFQASYCMFIVSDDNVSLIESRLGGKLKRPRVMKEFFDQTSSFIFTAVDQSMELIETRIEGVEASTTIDFSELKDKAKGDNSDLLKALLTDTKIF